MKKLLLITAILLAHVSIFSQLTGVANDCLEAIPICSNESYSTTEQGTSGSVCDITAANRGCIGSSSDPCVYEYSSTFFYFSIATGGTLEWLASNSGFDLDWALYGPFNTSDLSTICVQMDNMAPIRCNWCTVVGQPTGMVGNGGNGPCPPKSPNLNVLAGQTYLLALMQWSFPPSPIGFELIFNGGSGGNQANSTATFDCSILPAEFGEMYARNIGEGVQITWTTTMEQAIDHFSVLRWREGEERIEVASVASNGAPSKYTIFDELESGSYMYQIKTVEQDGSSGLSRILFANQENGIESPRLLRVSNAMSQVFDPMNLPNNQVLFFIYEGGEVEKIVFFQ